MRECPYAIGYVEEPDPECEMSGTMRSMRRHHPTAGGPLVIMGLKMSSTPRPQRKNM